MIKIGIFDTDGKEVLFIGQAKEVFLWLKARLEKEFEEKNLSLAKDSPFGAEAIPLLSEEKLSVVNRISNNLLQPDFQRAKLPRDFISKLFSISEKDTFVLGHRLNSQAVLFGELQYRTKGWFSWFNDMLDYNYSMKFLTPKDASEDPLSAFKKITDQSGHLSLFAAMQKQMEDENLMRDKRICKHFFVDFQTGVWNIDAGRFSIAATPFYEGCKDLPVEIYDIKTQETYETIEHFQLKLGSENIESKIYDKTDIIICIHHYQNAVRRALKKYQEVYLNEKEISPNDG